jgi:hypothetical protein
MEEKKARISLSRDWKPVSFSAKDGFSRRLLFSLDDLETLTSQKRETWPLAVESLDGYTAHYGTHLYIRVNTKGGPSFLFFIGNGTTLSNPDVTMDGKLISGKKDVKADELVKLIKRGLNVLACYQSKDTIDYHDLPEHKDIDISRQVTKEAKKRKALSTLPAVIAACQVLRQNSGKKDDWTCKVISRQLDMLVENRANLQEAIAPLVACATLQVYGVSSSSEEFKDTLEKAYGKMVAPEIPTPAILMMIGPFVCLADLFIAIKYVSKALQDLKVAQVLYDFIGKHADVLGQMMKQEEEDENPVVESMLEDAKLMALLKSVQRWPDYETRRKECFVHSM